MLPWRSWHLPGVQGCLGAVLRSPRDIQVLPWGQKGGGGGGTGTWGAPWAAGGGPRGAKGSKGEVLTFKSLWTMNFWWQYCTADTICRRGGCQEGPPTPGGAQGHPPAPWGHRGVPKPPWGCHTGNPRPVETSPGPPSPSCARGPPGSRKPHLEVGGTRQQKAGVRGSPARSLPAVTPPCLLLTPTGILHDEVKRLLRLDHLKKLHCKGGKAGLEGGRPGWGPPPGIPPGVGDPPKGRDGGHGSPSMQLEGSLGGAHLCWGDSGPSLFALPGRAVRNKGVSGFWGGGNEMPQFPMCPPINCCPPPRDPNPPPSPSAGWRN